MFVKLLFTSFLSLLVLPSCKQNSAVQESDQKPREIVFQLTKGACYGQCPVFDLYVFNTGKAMYHGKKFIDPEGAFEGKIDKALMKEIMIETAKILKPLPSDSVFATDLPMIKLGYRNEKKFCVWEGQGHLPKSVMTLDSLAHEVISSTAWEPVETSELLLLKKTLLPGEILLQLKEGFSIEQLETQYLAYQVTRVRRVTPNRNYWLITFDHRAIEPQVMLKYIKEDPMVVDAQFNQKLELRENEE